MLKKIGLSLLIIGAVLQSFAQKTDPKHENHFRDMEPIKTEDVTLKMMASHAQMNFASAKFEITNNTADYLIIQTGEIVFEFEHGKFSPKPSTIIIEPRKTIKKSFKVTGGDQFHVEKYTILFSGFYKASTSGKGQEAPNFILPATKNNFNAGSAFKCKVNGTIEKNTKLTEVPFECTYTGTELGIFDSAEAAVKLESGQEFANIKVGKSKLKALMGNSNVMFPGDSKKIMLEFKVPAKVTDMQFANMEIVWHNAFTETAPEELTIPSAQFTIDPGKTAGHNK